MVEGDRERKRERDSKRDIKRDRERASSTEGGRETEKESDVGCQIRSPSGEMLQDSHSLLLLDRLYSLAGDKSHWSHFRKWKTGEKKK